jgi:hypothetical protein
LKIVFRKHFWSHWKKIALMSAWRSGHRISLKNRRPGFESRQHVSFLGKHSIDVIEIDLGKMRCLPDM